MSVLSDLYGSVGNILFMKNDVNILRTTIRQKSEYGDMAATIKYFQELQVVDQSLFYSMDLHARRSRRRQPCSTWLRGGNGMVKRKMELAWRGDGGGVGNIASEWYSRDFRAQLRRHGAYNIA